MTTEELPKPYWHELPQDDIDKMIAEGQNVGYVMENYRQPDWCEYPNALGGVMGCWSLMDTKDMRLKISRDFCKDCDCFNKETQTKK